MDQNIKGVDLGIYPEIGEAKVIYRTPPEFMEKGSNQLITLAGADAPDQYILTFWTWARDSRYKPEVKGTWSSTERLLNKRQIHALQRMDYRGL